jgi:hypothetical protein
MSRLKFKIIRYTLLAYALLTLWQVFDKREDFPLSSFPMFAQVRGFPGTAGRTVLVGVNDHGEVPLDGKNISNLMSAPRLQKIFQQLQKKSDAEQAEFMSRVARMLQQGGDASEPLWGVRFYTETWRTQLHLKGIDHPQRELEFAGYIPPQQLVERLAAETKPGTPTEPARPLPAGDTLFELDRSACGDDCTVIDDPLAGAGHALRLAKGGSLHVTVPSGTNLFVRMRTEANAGDDRLALEVDGKRPKNAKEGIGNYKHQLPYDAWVWASLEPGWPALTIKARRGETSELVFRADRAAIDVDQIWLSREQRELPTWNAPLTASTGGGT